jgi:hypothetical protein
LYGRATSGSRKTKGVSSVLKVEWDSQLNERQGRKIRVHTELGMLERLRKVEQLKKIQFGWEIKGQNDKR